jgi:hypothetical protein
MTRKIKYSHRLGELMVNHTNIKSLHKNWSKRKPSLMRF